jgi:tetratricopeptide (TPR) repeat protein
MPPHLLRPALLLLVLLPLAPLTAQPPRPDEARVVPPELQLPPMLRPVTLDAPSLTLGELLDELASQAGISFVTTPAARDAGPFTLRVQGAMARSVLSGLEQLSPDLIVALVDEHLVAITHRPASRARRAGAGRPLRRPGTEPESPAQPPPVRELPVDEEPGELSLSELYYRSGMTEMAAGNTEAGRLWLRRALTLDPEHAGARQALEVPRPNAAPHPAESKDETDELLTPAGIYYRTGLQHRQDGNEELARLAFQRALALDPDHEGARQALQQD